MPLSFGLIYDLVFVIILVITALHGRRQGLLSGLVGLAGAVLGVLGAVWAAGELAPVIYTDHIGVAVGQTVTDALTTQGENLPAVMEQYLGFLPKELYDQVAGQLQLALESSSADISQQVVAALEPIFLPLLQAIIFLVLCTVIRWVFRLLAKLLRGCNDLPIVGGLNQTLGLLLGLVTGALDCWMLSLLLWGASSVTGGTLTWLAADVLSGSFLYRLYIGFNPFFLKPQNHGKIKVAQAAEDTAARAAFAPENASRGEVLPVITAAAAAFCNRGREPYALCPL